jgi:hypothetical protein
MPAAVDLYCRDFPLSIRTSPHASESACFLTVSLVTSPCLTVPGERVGFCKGGT